MAPENPGERPCTPERVHDGRKGELQNEHHHIRGLVVGVLSATLALAACASDDQATGATDPATDGSGSALDASDATSTSSADAVATSVTAMPSSTSSSAVPSSAPASSGATSPTTGRPDAEPTTTGSAASAPPSTEPPTVPPASPSPEQLESITFVHPEQPTRSASVFGFEYASFVEPDEVLTTIGAVLDEPDHDSGWQAMPASLPCKADLQYRSVLWDDLRVVLERRDSNGNTRLGAWSVGEVALSFSPPLATQISATSGVTSPSGLGIGSPTSAIADEGFPMVGADGDRVRALTGISPVVFEIGDDAVAAFSIEDNDCLAETADP